MVRDCPNCGLVNPPTATRCDCGFHFPGKLAVPARASLGHRLFGRSRRSGSPALLIFGVLAGILVGIRIAVPMRWERTVPATEAGDCGLAIVGNTIEGVVLGVFGGAALGLFTTLLLSHILGNRRPHV